MSRLLRTGLNAGDSAPLTVVGGEGVYFHLEDGRRLIVGSNTGGGLGHRHPAMVEAIRRAADTPVDQASAIFEVKIHPLAADDRKRRAVARVQAGSQQPTHLEISF